MASLPGAATWHQVRSQAYEWAWCSNSRSPVQATSLPARFCRPPPTGASEPLSGCPGGLWRPESAGAVQRRDSHAVCQGLRGLGGWTPSASSQDASSRCPGEESLMQWQDDLAGCRVVVRPLSRIPLFFSPRKARIPNHFSCGPGPRVPVWSLTGRLSSA